MKEDLLNVFGSYTEVTLDCIEKQNEKIEQLQQENQELIITNNNLKTSLDESQEVILDYKEENESSKQTINELTKQIAKLVEDKKYLENQINGYRNTNINLIDKNKYLEQEKKKLKERLKLLENVLVRDQFNFSKPQVLTFKIKILESRIDKAIEYIKGFDIEYLHETMEHGLADNLEIILKILKGDE